MGTFRPVLVSLDFQGWTIYWNAVLSEWQAQICFLLFFSQDALRFQSYFKSSEGREPHLEKWKVKIEVAKSEKMKGNCKT